MSIIKFLRAQGKERRVLEALYDGVPIIVTLDSSATMKLMGDRIGEFEPLLEGTSARIAAATERVIRDEGQVPAQLVLTALDLD